MHTTLADMLETMKFVSSGGRHPKACCFTGDNAFDIETCNQPIRLRTENEQDLGL